MIKPEKHFGMTMIGETQQPKKMLSRNGLNHRIISTIQY